MEKINAFFMIGIIGMVTTSSLEIFITAVLSKEFVQITSTILYPVFIVFLLIGTAVMIKRKKQRREQEQS
jgi:uncharacterized membrane protein YdjX (TVP38/TMEM64 family)